MDLRLRKTQLKILKVFATKAKTFALSGGTALDLYYLHHRFSVDLDFFSPKYDFKEIDSIVAGFKKHADAVNLESEFIAGGRARVRFYSIRLKEARRLLKIDFVEDVLFERPDIRKFERVPVYGVENIYLQKIVAIVGTRLGENGVGREIISGRKEARDVFDVYMLSKKIRPLHTFLHKVPRQTQRGMVQWYRSFSRQELKLALLDLDIYDRKFDAKEMVVYLEDEIKKFMKEELK